MSTYYTNENLRANSSQFGENDAGASNEHNDCHVHTNPQGKENVLAFLMLELIMLNILDNSNMLDIEKHLSYSYRYVTYLQEDDVHTH